MMSETTNCLESRQDEMGLAVPDVRQPLELKVGEHYVYRKHGVVVVTGMQDVTLGEITVRCVVASLVRSKLTITMPDSSVNLLSLRPLSTEDEMEKALRIISSGGTKLKGMWNRRAKEYEDKIHSGDVRLTAEVVRDLVKNIDDVERSYSERMICEAAIERLADEMAIIYGISMNEAKQRVTELAKQKVRFVEIKKASSDA